MRQRKGFTLVELSIVLVIIGLLIGGILTAQSMINTAKISAQVRQIGQFDAMVLNFKTKFNYLPGDAPAFGGDGDGIIDSTISAGGGVQDDVSAIFTCEIARFWYDLDQSQFPSTPASACNSVGLQAQASGSHKNVPASKLGSAGSFVIADSLATDNANYFSDKVNPKNYYVILSGTQLQSIILGRYHLAATNSANSAVKPVDLLALDKKIDDGLANAGNVVSGDITNANSNVGSPYISPLTTCSSGTSYIIANDSYECTPLIRIGGSVGVPQ